MCPVFSLANSGSRAAAVSGEAGSVKVSESGWLRLREDWPVLRPPTYLHFAEWKWYRPGDTQWRRTRSPPLRVHILWGK